MTIKKEVKKVSNQISEDLKLPQLKKEIKDHYSQLGKEVKDHYKQLGKEVIEKLHKKQTKSK